VSGYPHGLNDDTLRPGHDYKLRGNEIVPVGGIMNLRKLTLWHTIDWYASSVGTEHEREQRRVLDQAIDAALADTADAPPEPTEEMVEAALAVETDEGGPISQDIGFGMMRLMLEAALAAAQKEG